VTYREFLTADEAAAAFGRANGTKAAVVALIRHSKRPGVSHQERAEKAAEIAELRRQARAEMEPVTAFYRELIRKANQRRR
jgi:exopolyphosphatase/pppGpp-phosphohydrolase